MTTSPQQQLLETIPTLRNWQSRLLVKLLQFLGWMRSSSSKNDRLTPGLTPEQKAAVTRLQQRIREVVPEGESLATELIQERRAASSHE